MINEKFRTFTEGIQKLKLEISLAGNDRAFLFPCFENVIKLYFENAEECIKVFMETNTDRRQYELIQSLKSQINEFQTQLYKALEMPILK
jgi:hypothetical protein